MEKKKVNKIFKRLMLPPTRYMLAVMLLASCTIAGGPKFVLSWFPWVSWYSAGIGMETSYRSSLARNPSWYIADTCLSLSRSPVESTLRRVTSSCLFEPHRVRTSPHDYPLPTHTHYFSFYLFPLFFFSFSPRSNSLSLSLFLAWSRSLRFGSTFVLLVFRASLR